MEATKSEQAMMMMASVASDRKKGLRPLQVSDRKWAGDTGDRYA